MRKILVVEDEDNIRAFVVLNLKRVGYEVVDVGSGEAAMEAFEAAGGDFDIAILDIMLPGIDGLGHSDQCPDIRIFSAEAVRNIPACQLSSVCVDC